MKIAGTLYKLARASRDYEVLLSMQPKKIVRHFLVNKVIMKKMGKFALWKR